MPACPGPFAAVAVLIASVLTAGLAPAQTYTFSTLGTFTGLNGANPVGGVIQDAAGNLYGTTVNGGTNSAGTVYKVAAGSATVTTLASFNYSANGSNPNGMLVRDGSGNLFGAARTGPNGGSVFKVDGTTNALTTVTPLPTAVGGTPQGGLIRDGSGNLYGTSLYGGANGYGAVYKVSSTGAVSAVASFNNTNGSTPYGGLVLDGNGNLFGTTYTGGANSKGTVFEIAAGSGTVTTLATFNTTNGSNPQGTLTRDAAGNLYGTTQYGGANGYGTVFKVDGTTHALTTLATFNNTNGANPEGGLVADAVGNLFGTTYAGGASNKGTVFEVAAGSGTVTTLHTFAGGAEGANPYADLTLGADGRTLFGTTFVGGSAGDGTVFSLTPTPEPAAVGLVAAAGLGVGGWVRRRRAGRAEVAA